MHRGHVLIVDDDQNLAFVLRAHLTNNGLDVDVAHDGQAGLAYIREHLPEVVILDVQLPSLNGLDLIRMLRQDPRTEPIPVILLTGRGSPNDIVLGLEAGAQDYIVKPFDVAELSARVRAMLKLSRAQREIDDLNARLADEVRRKTERLELLYTFVRALSRATDVQRVCDLMIEAVQKATGCQRVSIMLPDPVTGRLVCKRAVGIDPGVAEQVSVAPNTGIAGQVFTTGSTVVARAVDSPGRQPRDYQGDAFMSTPLVSTYLMNGEERLGVLNATDKPDGAAFNLEEVECIRSITDSAAIALHNEQRRSGLTKATRALLLTAGRLSEYRDEETGLHLERVREYAQILGTQLAAESPYRPAVTPEFLEDLYQAAPLHDLGKVGIPDEILNKPGKLSDEEFQIMKTHTTIGRHTLATAMEETGPVPLLQMCIDIAYCHHERWDGRGYPRGIAAAEIPLAARIITLVDAYDAMTSERCYKRALPHWKAVDIIGQEAGRHFDPDIVAAFQEVAEEFDRVRAAKADPVSASAPTPVSTATPAGNPAAH